MDELSEQSVLTIELLQGSSLNKMYGSKWLHRGLFSLGQLS